MSKALYTSMVNITKDYLGPAADRFMARHIESHLHIQPAEITIEKIPELTAWLKISMSLLTRDSKLVDDFSNRMKGLR